MARALAARLGLPVIHLDRLYHDPERRFVQNRLEWRAYVLEELLPKDEWVMDGHYSSTLAQRLSAAEAVVYLSYPTRTAFAGILKRRFQRQPDRQDMPEGWRERVSVSLLWSVLTFRIREARKLDRLLISECANATIVRLRAREEADRLVASIGDD